MKRSRNGSFFFLFFSYSRKESKPHSVMPEILSPKSQSFGWDIAGIFKGFSDVPLGEVTKYHKHFIVRGSFDTMGQCTWEGVGGDVVEVLFCPILQPGPAGGFVVGCIR